MKFQHDTKIKLTRGSEGWICVAHLSVQLETWIAYGIHVCYWIGTKLALFIEDIPIKFRFIWPSGFIEEDF